MSGHVVVRLPPRPSYVREIFDPKTAFGNPELIGYIRAQELEQARLDAAEACGVCDPVTGKAKARCEECDGTGEITITCETCDGEGEAAETCNHGNDDEL